MTILGRTRQTPIVIDDDDDCVQPYRPAPGILTRARMNSENNFEKDMHTSGGWKQPRHNENHDRDSFPPSQTIGRADTGSETASQMKALGAPTSNFVQPLKRKRSYEDAPDSAYLPRLTFADGRFAPQSSGSDPFAGLSKTQRKKLRKRMRAEGTVASRANLSPQAKMLPAEAILGYTVQHRTNETPFENDVYDGPNWPGRSLPGPVSQFASIMQTQSPAVGSLPVPPTSFPSRPTEPMTLGVPRSVSKQAQQDIPSHAYFPHPVQEFFFQPAQPSEPIMAQSTKVSGMNVLSCNLFAAKSRIIGSPAPHGSGHGLFPLAPDQYVPHDPAHTLIMEGMPKKFRTLEFVLQWCVDTGSEIDPSPLHVDVTRKLGKALIEFSTRERAIRAYNSPKLINKDGREQISLYWYRPESSLPPPTLPPQPIRALPAIPPPPPQSMQPRRPIEAGPSVTNIQPTKKLEDMEEGEIDEVTEVDKNGFQVLPTGRTLQWSPGRSSHWVLSSGLTPTWEPSDDYYDSIKSSGRTPQWTSEVDSSGGDFVAGQSLRTQHESEPAGLRISEPANLFEGKGSLSSHSRRDATSSVVETLEPKSQDSVATIVQASSTKSSPAIKAKEDITMDMEVDSELVANPVFSTFPSRDIRPSSPHDLDSSRNVKVEENGLNDIHPSARAIKYEGEERDNRDNEPAKVEETRNGVSASSVAPEQAANVADRLSELRQRVLASKRKKLEACSASTAFLARSSVPSVSTKEAGNILDTNRSSTPSSFSTISSASNDSLFSRTSVISTTTSSVSVSPVGASTAHKSASYLDSLATAFLQDIIGSDKSFPATIDPERTIVDHASVDSKTVLLDKQNRLEQHITNMKQLMAQLSSATKKLERDKLMRTIRETERTFNAENAAADAALKRMATATKGKNEFSIPWPQTKWDQMVLVVSDSEDGGCDSEDDE